MTPLLVALAFLTRIPMPVGAVAPEELGRSARFYPLAGAVVAMAMLVAVHLGTFLISAPVGALLAVAAGVIVTGGLHLDGLSDCFDGLLCNGDRARRLTVMHDPRVGALAVVGMCLWVGLKVLLVHETITRGNMGPALWATAILSRGFLPAELFQGPPATPGQGLYATLHKETGLEDAVVALVMTAALIGPVAVLFPHRIFGMLLGVGLALSATAAWHGLWRRLVGGITGDVLGGSVEIREMCLLLAMASPLLLQ